jgi:DNA-binding response OmpR family regulator
VLIAEDDARVARQTARLIDSLGYAVVGVAGDGVQAVNMTATTQPDVVLMDLLMPELDGLEASRRIQARSRVPIVALSGVTTDEMGEAAGKAGIAAFLVKPLRPHEVVCSISHVLARHAMTSQGPRPRWATPKLEQTAADTQHDENGATEQDRDADPPVPLPMCSLCKRVRTATSCWSSIEGYLLSYHGVQVTHGLCPACVRERYPDFID